MKLNQDVIFALTVQALWVGGLVIVSYVVGFNAGRDAEKLSRRKTCSAITANRSRS